MVKSKMRSLLVRGAKALAVTSVLLAFVSCSHGKTDTGNTSNKTEVTTSCTTSTTTSTVTTSTTSSTTTTSTTTTAVTTTEIIIQTIVSENIAPIEPVYVEPQTEYIPPVTELPITEYERTLLRNVVANEYGSDWVSVSEKAKVVATVMNRVNSPQFPNTIESVLTQPYQFSGYYASNYEWGTVTDSVREAVDYYFEHPEEYGNYLYFWGDGQYNHFY